VASTWAYGHTTSSANAAGLGLAAAGSVGHEKNGSTAGAGLEYAFNPWLSFKVENLYHDLGTDALVSGAVTGVPFSLSEKTTAHTVKIGVNVKLKVWPARRLRSADVARSLAGRDFLDLTYCGPLR
jgi:opacity protein-like surface antigen